MTEDGLIEMLLKNEYNKAIDDAVRYCESHGLMYVALKLRQLKKG